MRSLNKPSLFLAGLMLMGTVAISPTQAQPSGTTQTQPDPNAQPEKDPDFGIPDRPGVTPKPVKRPDPYSPRRRPKGGITGIITVNPVCSVVVVDPKCIPKLYKGRLVIRRQSDGRLFRAETGADGRYSLNLDPGVYTIAPETIGTLPASASQTVRILKNRTSVIDITFQGNTQ